MTAAVIAKAMGPMPEATHGGPLLDRLPAEVPARVMPGGPSVSAFSELGRGRLAQITAPASRSRATQGASSSRLADRRSAIRCGGKPSSAHCP
jgi:hypothetical protein